MAHQGAEVGWHGGEPKLACCGLTGWWCKGTYLFQLTQSAVAKHVLTIIENALFGKLTLSRTDQQQGKRAFAIQKWTDSMVPSQQRHDWLLFMHSKMIQGASLDRYTRVMKKNMVDCKAESMSVSGYIACTSY